MDQQPHPDLPLDGIRIAAQEIGQLQGLLDLLEKRFDVSPATPTTPPPSNKRFKEFV